MSAAAVPDSARSPGPVEDIVDRLDETAQGRERVTLGDVVEAFGRRSFLPMLMVPALLVLSPLSGIPLFSSVCGITIALIAAQMLWPGRDHLWLPDRLMRQNISGARARKSVAQLGRIARRLDGLARDRLKWFVGHRPGRTLLEASCFVAGAAMPFFEIVPFTSSILGFAVLLMATALLTRDGIFALAGLVVIVLAPTVPLLVVGNVTGGS
jgi:hypothetical protein